LETKTHTQKSSSKDTKSQETSSFNFKPRYKQDKPEYSASDSGPINWRDEPVFSISAALDVLENLEHVSQGSPRIYSEREFPATWFKPSKKIEDETVSVSNVYAEEQIGDKEIEYRFRTYQKESGEVYNEVEITANYEQDEDIVIEHVKNVYNDVLAESDMQELQIEDLKMQQ